ncbi:MAG: NAD-dependent epimerase/dehydratase family protein [Patescibacteria group bacterium]
MSRRAIFNKNNVLVTGGAGFIGSHLCDELIKNNKVICLDNLSTGDERNIDHLLSDPDFEFVRHDITQPIDLENDPSLQKFKIQFQGVQYVYHLACPMSPKNFKKHRIDNLLANSYGVKNALAIAGKYDAKFLHFSSAVVYGPRREGNEKIREDDIGKVDLLSQRSSYDEGKRFAETMVANYGEHYNLDTKIARLFRVYGPRMKLNDEQMLPDFINNALEDKELFVYGDSDFSSSFCYISDVVDFCTKIMETEKQGPYNVGSDVDINVSDLAKKIIKKTGSNSEVKYEQEKLFMSRLPLPDISKAVNELGWMPIMTLDKGLDRTIDYLKANRGVKKFEEMEY